jgi:hypothetical protein
MTVKFDGLTAEDQKYKISFDVIMSRNPNFIEEPLIALLTQNKNS